MSEVPTFSIPQDRPLRVVTVCLGNICRSPMVASVLRARVAAAGLHERVVIDSAGTSGWHIGQSADKRAAATLVRHGYDDSHIARQLTSHDLADFDLVVVADQSNLADVSDLARTPSEVAKVHLFRSFDPKAPQDPEIPDPYYGSGDGFEIVLHMIEAAADGFVDVMQRHVDSNKSGM